MTTMAEPHWDDLHIDYSTPERPRRRWPMWAVLGVVVAVAAAAAVWTAGSSRNGNPAGPPTLAPTVTIANTATATVTAMATATVTATPDSPSDTQTSEPTEPAPMEPTPQTSTAVDHPATRTQPAVTPVTRASAASDVAPPADTDAAQLPPVGDGAAPSIGALSCQRDGAHFTSTASFHAGGDGMLTITIGPVKTSTAVTASISSATASADITAKPVTCVATLTTGAGTATRSVASN